MQSTSARIAQLARNNEARLEKEVHQTAAQASVATERLQASEAQTQLRLQDQAQISATIAELRKAPQETSDQALAHHSRGGGGIRKQLLEAQLRFSELEPA